MNSNSIPMKRFDLTAANNSADENPSSISTKTNRSRSNSSTRIPSKKISSRTRVTVRRSVSNSNLGTINSHIVVRPVPSKTSDVQQRSNVIDQREKLADEQCRRSYEAMLWMSRAMCCSHCRPICHPCAAQPIPSMVPDEQQIQFSAKESAPIVQRSLTSIKSRLISSKSETSDREAKTTVSDFNRQVAEHDQSMFSFPDHFSQTSERTIKDNPQLDVDTHVFVDDLIRTAEEKYQRILRMSVNEDLPEQNSLSEKSTTKAKQKLVTISEHPTTSNDHGLCAELCQQLNLSSSDQINEIVRILASNAPHILKENSSKPTVQSENFGLINRKISESNLCQQLLLHPPFKPKRLIYLCPDGGIQVLSAVDENIQETQSNNEQNYRLNYSNSAIKPRLSSTDERSVALELETTTTLTTINVKPMLNNPRIFTEHDIQLDQSSLDDQSIQSNHNDPLPITNSNQIPINHNQHTEMNSKNHPIVNIDLFNDDDNEDLLPTLVFKRIIALDHSSANICH